MNPALEVVMEKIEGYGVAEHVASVNESVNMNFWGAEEEYTGDVCLWGRFAELG